MVVKNVLSGATPESSISAQLGWDLVTETAKAYGLYRFHGHQTIQWPLLPSMDGGIIILWQHSHGSQNNSLPSIFIQDPKHDGMLIA